MNTKHRFNLYDYCIAISASLIAGIIITSFLGLIFYAKLLIIINIILMAILVILAIKKGLFEGILIKRIQSRDDIKYQIKKTQKEIHAFQISGGYNTFETAHIFKKWLEQDNDRKLKLMYIDPDNMNLVKSVGFMTGRISQNNNNFLNSKNELAEFRNEIIQSILKFISIKEQLANSDQIKIRVYGSAPAASIFASDIYTTAGKNKLIFVEHYLHKEPWDGRLCFALKYGDKKHKYVYNMYQKSIRNLWKDGMELATNVSFRRSLFMWSDIDEAFKKVKANIEKYRPEVIIGLADGRIIGGIIAQNLRIENFFGIDIPIFDKNGDLIMEQNRPIYGKICKVEGKKILLVDNHVFTGTNMRIASKYIEQNFNPGELKTLVNFKNKMTTFDPSYFAEEFEDKRVSMPWSYTKQYANAYGIE